MKLIEGDARKPIAGWLNYPADFSGLDPYRPYGPTYMNEWLWPVEMERLEDRVRVGFAYQQPPAPDPETYA